MSNLKPNTQYIVYVVALGPNGKKSLASETLVAWTDPALSAFVDVSNYIMQPIAIFCIWFYYYYIY